MAEYPLFGNSSAREECLKLIGLLRSPPTFPASGVFFLSGLPCLVQTVQYVGRSLWRASVGGVLGPPPFG